MKDSNPLYVKIIFWLQRRKYGSVLSSARMWARSPKIFLALSALYGCLERKSSPISPLLRSLILVRVSQINGCSFCIDLNRFVLFQRGFDIKKFEQLSKWQSSDLYTDQEKAVLEYTEVVTHSTTMDEQRSKIRSFFSEEEVVELTALVAFQNMSTKFNNAFGIEPQGFCPTTNQ
jgi:alkylhydroperoxidase family enzyme